MSDAETSAYLLIAGGLIWVAMGILGFVWVKRRRR
jgi:LPXTG-motif cell wall-anchored protein